MAEENTTTITTEDAKQDENTPKDVANDNTHDDIEASLGISEYLSQSTPGFSAVVKARYSDFLVHEIAEDGSIARLTSLEVPKSKESDTSSKKEATKIGLPTKPPSETVAPTAITQSQNSGDKMETDSDKNNSESKENDETKSSSLGEFESQLSKMINNPDVAKKVMAMLEEHNKTSSESSESKTNKESVASESKTDDSTPPQTAVEKYVTLPPLEKEQRKAVHEWVRNSLKCARADTLDGKIRIWHCKFEKEMPNYKAFGTHKKRKMSDRAMKKKARAEWPSDRPDFLRFILYKENCDTTTATKEISRRGSTARIGYAGMKDKRGITTQFCTLYRTLPEQIAQGKHPQQRGGGGGNTKQKGYSIVHIGNFEYIAKELRLGSLKGNRFDIILRNVKLLDSNNASDDTSKRREILEAAAKAMKDRGFINYFGTQRFGKFHNTHKVGIAVLQGDFEKAIDILMAPNSEDRPDISKARKDWQDRFTYGKTKENESSTAKRVLKRLNRFMSAEIAVLQSLARNPFDYQRAFRCISKNMRMMFIHAVQSLVWNQATSHRIGQMSSTSVLVGDLVPNSNHNNTRGHSGGVESTQSSSRVHIVTEEDVANQTYTLEDVLIPVVGTKTVFPNNSLGDVLKKLLKDLGLTLEMFQNCKDREIRANGDYRKAIIHPNDFDFTIREYYHPLQPLLQTDLMKLHSQDIVIEPPAQESEEKGEENPAPPKALVAMVVGFSLPSSSYATIALRELMKIPTSNEYQSKLKLE